MNYSKRRKRRDLPTLDEARQQGLLTRSRRSGHYADADYLVEDIGACIKVAKQNLKNTADCPTGRAFESCATDLIVRAIDQLSACSATPTGKGSLPKCTPTKRRKLERCIRQVKAQGTAANPWAVCQSTLGCKSQL